MGRRIFPLVLLAGFLALAACAAQEEAKPAAPAAPPAAPAAKPAWEQEWERVLAAAKREGKVVVSGPMGAPTRQALTELFEKNYGITVEYMAESGSEAVERIKTERGAGQYLRDIYISGSSTILALKDIGAYDPIESALILPEVKEPKNWKEGRIFWTDKDRVAITTQPQSTGIPYINPKLVKAAEFKSWKDLLDPKWKGKIVVGRDPRSAGPGQAVFTFFYMHPELGPDFIRALAKQEIVLVRDDRQAAEWVVQGRYPIGFGIGKARPVEMAEKGLPIEPLDAKYLKEGLHLSTSSSNVALMNRAPHPNAVKVYINWLLGKEAQLLWSKVSGGPSWRVDVPVDHLESWSRYDPRSIRTDSEEALAVSRGPLAKLLSEVFRD